MEEFRTVKAFCGADMVVRVAGITIGEITEVTMNHEFGTGAVTGIITAMITDNLPGIVESVQAKMNKGPITMEIELTNELGQRVTYTIENLSIPSRFIGMDVNNPLLHEIYTYDGTDLVVK